MTISFACSLSLTCGQGFVVRVDSFTADDGRAQTPREKKVLPRVEFGGHFWGSAIIKTRHDLALFSLSLSTLIVTKPICICLWLCVTLVSPIRVMLGEICALIALNFKMRFKDLEPQSQHSQKKRGGVWLDPLFQWIRRQQARRRSAAPKNYRSRNP